MTHFIPHINDQTDKVNSWKLFYLNFSDDFAKISKPPINKFYTEI